MINTTSSLNNYLTGKCRSPTLEVDHKSALCRREDDKAFTGSRYFGFSIITEGQTVLARQIAGVMLAMS